MDCCDCWCSNWGRLPVANVSDHHQLGFSGSVLTIDGLQARDVWSSHGQPNSRNVPDHRINNEVTVMMNILVRGQAPGILIISNSCEEFEGVGKAGWGGWRLAYQPPGAHPDCGTLAPDWPKRTGQ